ncbi:SUR7 protein [Xylariaceae sp. FL0594]|nr:SUR7 protein [Xylariaceae sp. FL0594]
MGGVGRYFCVALPFILTVASIIAALIVGLTGVTDNGLYLFRIDNRNLSIDASQLQEIIKNASAILSGNALDDITNNVTSNINQASQDVQDHINDIASRSPVEWHDPTLLEADSNKAAEEDVVDVDSILNGTMIKASDVGLANIYDFTLWSLCVTPQDGKKNCTKAQFDWASKELDLGWLQRIDDAAHLNITIPKEVNDGLNLFKTITKWTEIVFIIAIVALALELAAGLFTACSRAVSCVTWVISGFATLAIVATAVLLTVTASVVTGTIWAASHEYGVKTSVNTGYLAIAWLSVVFAVGAGLFWLFSICCCAPERRPYGRKSRHLDSEKPSGSYAPLGENRISGYSNYNNFGGPQRGGARSDLAYEPYSHSRV